MGRGRAKAKQTKVARELKYSSQGTDFTALQRELSGSGSSNGGAQHRDSDVDETDEYDDWAAEGR
jgi:hypothetical protein